VINKPGTLLIVRKKDRGIRPLPTGPTIDWNSGISNVFRLKIEKPLISNIWWVPFVDLPYGACVLLLSLKTAEHHAAGGENKNKNMKTMEILYNEQTLVGTLSSNQCNKWFTYPGTWKKHYMKPEQEESEKTENEENLEISTTSMNDDCENNMP